MERLKGMPFLFLCVSRLYNKALDMCGHAKNEMVYEYAL